MSVKRTVCGFWQQGKCERGANCGFAHGEHELGTLAGPPAPGACAEKRSICRFWEEGTCEKGGTCTFAHGAHELGQQVPWAPAPKRGAQRAAPYSPAPRLSSFASPSPTAVFSGGAKRSAPPLMLTGPGATPRRSLCKFWLEGHCKDGNSCTWAHGERQIGTIPGVAAATGPETKRTMCKFYQEGHCERGAVCGFAHNPYEIGQPVPGVTGAGIQVTHTTPASISTKRTLCKFFLEGGCERGAACGFAHSQRELGQPVPGALTTAALGRAPVVATRGPQATTKRTMCKFFQEGHCERGAGCGFAHGEHEIGQTTPAIPPKNGRETVKRTICKFYQDGSCPRGASCGFAHGEHEIGTPVGEPEKPTTRRTMCKFNQQGTCERGDKCTFAHYEWELGTPIIV